jgi:tetrahydromethanopterin S-methyltransferase subunit G
MPENVRLDKIEKIEKKVETLLAEMSKLRDRNQALKTQLTDLQARLQNTESKARSVVSLSDKDRLAVAGRLDGLIERLEAVETELSHNA